YNLTVVLFASLGSFSYGYSSSIIASVFGLPSFFSYFNLSLIGPNATKANDIIGAANGLFYGGGIIGALTVNYVLNKFGRCKSIQSICAICIVSSAIQGGAIHIAMILVGRFLSGIGVGMMQVVIPAYMSELSPAKQRGRMTGSHGVFIVVGYTVAALAGLGCYFSKPEVEWRLCLSLQVVAPLILLSGSAWLPESPRWLLSQGRDQQTLDILRDLHDQGDGSSGYGANEEFYQILIQLELEKKDEVFGIWDMLKRRSYRKRILAGLLIEFASQSTGVLVINNYQVLLYNNLGLYGWLPLLLYTIFSAWGAFSNWVNSLLLDWLGRIPVLTYGLIGCISVMIVETALVASYASTSNKGGNAAAILFLFLFIMFYGGTQDASSYVYCSEIFPTRVRAHGLGICIAGLFATALLYTQVYPTAFDNIGWKYYIVFILVPAACVPFVRRLPETNGLSLEEITAKFGDEVTTN
ncbi:general substrate transporter, partial [Talaromyces proteolyticus]